MFTNSTDILFVYIVPTFDCLSAQRALAPKKGVAGNTEIQ